MDARTVHFDSKEEGCYHFLCPDGAQLLVSAQDVGRSNILHDMLNTATDSEETRIVLPSDAELSHFHIWASALQPDSHVLEADAKCLKRSLEVLEGMRREIASMVLAASSRSVGERAWRMPTRLHYLDEAITAAAADAKAQRKAPHGEQRQGLDQGQRQGLDHLPWSVLPWSVAWSPNGSMLAAGLGRQITVWDAATGYVKYNVEENGQSLAWSPDGRLLDIGYVTDDGSDQSPQDEDSSVGGSDQNPPLYGIVKVWEVAAGTITREIGVPDEGEVTPLAWSPCGRLVFAVKSGAVHIYYVSED